MPGYQFRKVVFTHHDVENPPKLGEMQYLAYAVETCPTTGKKHLQGFAYGPKWTFKKWKEALPTAHIEEMQGTFRQNEKYCSKEGELQEFGDRPMENGKRKAYEMYKDRIEKGDNPKDVAREGVEEFMTWTQNYRAFELYRQHVRQESLRDDRTQPNVFVRIGPAGTGKTKWLDDMFGFKGWTFAPDNTGRWFDGCDCDVVVFDDVERGQVPPLSLWKRLNDRYGLSVPVKGGYIYWKPKYIVWTSNSAPTEWWPDLTSFDIAAIERRITSLTVVEEYISNPPIHEDGLSQEHDWTQAQTPLLEEAP